MTNSKINAHVLSDLHLEHMNRNQVDDFFVKLISHIDTDKPDIAILAGDITNLSEGYKDEAYRQFKVFSGLYKHVLYVPGNHEFYGTSFVRGAAVLFDVAMSFGNIQQLSTGYSFVLDQQRFVGDTMWFSKPDLVVEDEGKRGLMDYRAIKDFRPTVYEKNDKFNKDSLPGIKTDDIVITHHLPFPESVAPRFRGSSFNHFFLHDCSMAFNASNAPKAWIHGHSHDACDYKTALGTRVYANPKGYPNTYENAQFWDRLLVTF